MSELNIFQRMSADTSKLERVAKNLTVGIRNNAYKAVGEADVLAAVKPLEEEYGIYSYPVNRDIVETNVLTTTSEYNGQTSEKKQLFLRIRTVYRFVNVDKPDDYIEITSYADGIDSGDKACGKAMTYADKYALLKAYKIETGDDPDQEASGGLKATDRPMNSVKKNEPKNAPAEPQMTVEQALEVKINGVTVKEIYKDKEMKERIAQIYEASTPEQRTALNIVNEYIKESRTKK